MFRTISIILLLSISFAVSAQEADTVKESKIVKQWSLSSDFSEEVSIPFDTLFSLFNRYRLTDKKSPYNAYLGNYGLPLYQINFFDRITDPDKFLYSPYYPFMHTSDNAVFLNTRTPFTDLAWTFGAPRETSEQTLRLRHSQNVNRFFNFGLIFDVVYSLGQLNYQRSENKNFTFFTSYTGEKYNLYLSTGLNNMKSFENGGIVSKDQMELDNPRDIPVNLGGLNNSISLLKNKNLMLVQRYTFGGSTINSPDSVVKKRSGFFGLTGTLSHILLLDGNRRTYSDESPGSGFYDTIFINEDITFDSLYSRSVKNIIRFDFTTDETRKFRLGGGVGIRNELLRYSQIVPTHDTMFADTLEWNKSINILVGKLYNSIGEKFQWSATGELFFTGYRVGDFNLNGLITTSLDLKKGRAFLLLEGAIANRQPSFWVGQWGSNHFEWNSNFNKEFRIDIGSTFTYPARHAEIKFNYAIIDNYTDFGLDALPSQNSGGISVAAFNIHKDMRAWKFHLATDLLIQKSSNEEILSLPLATIRSAGYFENLFKFKQTGGSLNTQIGIDLIYHSLYNPYSYMPATGRFYRQETNTGNYPFVNAFLNLKLKRTRLFIMFDHLNYGMMGEKLNKNFDMIPNYLLNRRMFRYGIAWTFYD